MSNVWLVTSAESRDPVRLEFRADSDAHIVRGLVAVLLAAYSGRSPEQILATDIRGLFERLDLASHLSPSRSNGFFAMVERIRGHRPGLDAERERRLTRRRSGTEPRSLAPARRGAVTRPGPPGHETRPELGPAGQRRSV